MTENKVNRDDPEEESGTTNVPHHGSRCTRLHHLPGNNNAMPQPTPPQDIGKQVVNNCQSGPKLDGQGESTLLAQPQSSLHTQGENHVDARDSTNTPDHSTPTSTSSLPSSDGDHHESPYNADSEASSASSDSDIHRPKNNAHDDSLIDQFESAEPSGPHITSPSILSLTTTPLNVADGANDANGGPPVNSTELHKSPSLMEKDGPTMGAMTDDPHHDLEVAGTHAQPMEQNEAPGTTQSQPSPSIPPHESDDNASPPLKRKNIIVFGETGTGKSSLINMIAGDTAASVSNRAVGCTFDSTPHYVTVGEELVTLWDTAGLNEGDNGTISPEQAILNLHDLVGRLQPDGLKLLVYCFRGTRFRSVLRENYEMFCRSLGQNKIPIVAVVTGLECEVDREDWWRQNEYVFKENGMAFDAHACVTTFKGKKLEDGEHMFEVEYEHSRKDVQNLIEAYCRGESGKIYGGGLVGIRHWLARAVAALTSCVCGVLNYIKW